MCRETSGRDASRTQAGPFPAWSPPSYRSGYRMSELRPDGDVKVDWMVVAALARPARQACTPGRTGWGGASLPVGGVAANFVWCQPRTPKAARNKALARALGVPRTTSCAPLPGRVLLDEHAQDRGRPRIALPRRRRSSVIAEGRSSLRHHRSQWDVTPFGKLSHPRQTAVSVAWSLLDPRTNVRLHEVLLGSTAIATWSVNSRRLNREQTSLSPCSFERRRYPLARERHVYNGRSS